MVQFEIATSGPESGSGSLVSQRFRWDRREVIDREEVAVTKVRSRFERQVGFEDHLGPVSGVSDEPRHARVRPGDAAPSVTTFDAASHGTRGERKVQTFSCLDQFLCMAFAQLTYRESLRDIEACLRAQRSELYHMGIRSTVARNTLANANAVRDWRIHADLAQSLIGIARPLHADEPFGVELTDAVYALDASTIDLCLSMFPWAPFKATKAAIKLHTLLDLRGNIPTFVHISDGKLHDVNVLDQIMLERSAFYVMDRGYLDFRRLFRFEQAGSSFVIRSRSNIQSQRRYSREVDRSTGLICDQTVILTGMFTPAHYPAPLRRIRFRDPTTGKLLVFFTNNFGLPP